MESFSVQLEQHTPGPWGLCHHLQSAEKDAACPCGYRGGIWGPDGEHIICEMGSTETEGQEGLSPARYDRPTELANALLIAAAPDMLAALHSACSSNPDWELITSAIAKAEGRALPLHEGSGE